MMVDSVLKELGRAEAGLASRNRFLSKLNVLPFAFMIKTGNQWWRLHISSSSTSPPSVRIQSWSPLKRLDLLLGKQLNIIISKETEGDADEQEGKQGYLAARQCLRCFLLYLEAVLLYLEATFASSRSSFAISGSRQSLKWQSVSQLIAYLRPSPLVSVLYTGNVHPATSLLLKYSTEWWHWQWLPSRGMELQSSIGLSN